jgi:hypothetical protein
MRYNLEKLKLKAFDIDNHSSVHSYLHTGHSKIVLVEPIFIIDKDIR